MDRRSFIQTTMGLLAATTLPAPLRARTSIGNQAAFLKALEGKPWLLGFLGAPATELKGNIKIVSGRVPDDLRGQFFRNGPAMHNIGTDRFLHWFDSPGMLQRFNFGDGNITHHGRLIETARNVTETREQKISFNAFATHGHNLTSGGSADAQNTANISVIKHADELLTLWEGGSAYVMDADTLNTKGVKTWSDETQGLPFGAHPRVDKNGSLWNIGYLTNPSVLIVYHISPQGQLKNLHVIAQKHIPMVHDFMITDTKLVIIAPPFRASNTEGESFLDLFEWKSQQNGKVFILDKNNLNVMKEIEIDPFWVFHFGNAYDISANEIGFDFAKHDAPSFMTGDAFYAMDGSWNGQVTPDVAYVQARIDLSAKRMVMESVNELGKAEFIKIDPRDASSKHRYSLMLGVSERASALTYFNRLLLFDRQSGTSRHFDAANTEIFEEHLIVPKPNSTGFWIMGTALDWARGVTTLSVYDGDYLPDGPVVKAELDIPLPLGLHGAFIAA